MTKSDVIERTREEILDDATTPYLWPDTELGNYFDEAITEACKRAPLLVGSTTYDIEAGTPEIVLDTVVRQILLAKVDSQTNPLTHTTEDALTLNVGASWRTRTGTPTHYVRRGKVLTLYPNPLIDDVLVVKSTQLPGLAFDIDTDIELEYQHGVMFYIAYKAYLKRDADTYNPQASADYLNKFDAMFGLPKSAKWHRAAQDMPMNAVVMGGRIA